MPFNLGLPEALVLFAIALLLFGPKKLPELGKSIGDAINNFKKSINGDNPPSEPEDKQKPS